MYVGGGTLYNNIVLGKSGAAALPHQEFWTTVLGLVLDGTTFTKQLVMPPTTVRPLGVSGGSDSLLCDGESEQDRKVRKKAQKYMKAWEQARRPAEKLRRGKSAGVHAAERTTIMECAMTGDGKKLKKLLASELRNDGTGEPLSSKARAAMLDCGDGRGRTAFSLALSLIHI